MMAQFSSLEIDSARLSEWAILIVYTARQVIYSNRSNFNRPFVNNRFKLNLFNRERKFGG
jgi:hypothetical protein